MHRCAIGKGGLHMLRCAIGKEGLSLLVGRVQCPCLSISSSLLKFSLGKGFVFNLLQLAHCSEPACNGGEDTAETPG